MMTSNGTSVHAAANAGGPTLVQSHCFASREHYQENSFLHLCFVFALLKRRAPGVVNKCEEVANTYSMGHIYKRVGLHYARIGIAKGKTRNDRCPDCVCWDKVVDKRLLNVIADGIDRGTEFMTEYWRPFQIILTCKNSGCNEPHFEKIESVAWMTALRDYIRTHRDKQAVAIAELARKKGPQWEFEMQEWENEFVSKLDDAIEELKVYVAHWALRNRIWSFKISKRLRTEPYEIIFESDWGDT